MTIQKLMEYLDKFDKDKEASFHLTGMSTFDIECNICDDIIEADVEFDETLELKEIRKEGGSSIIIELEHKG